MPSQQTNRGSSRPTIRAAPAAPLWSCGCRPSDGSGSSQSNVSEVVQGSPEATGGSAGAYRRQWRQRQHRQHPGSATATPKPQSNRQEQKESNSCGCDGHTEHGSDNDAHANGGDTSATSGDATGGDGGNATPNGGDAVAVNESAVKQTNDPRRAARTIPRTGIAAARSIRRSTRRTARALHRATSRPSIRAAPRPTVAAVAPRAAMAATPTPATPRSGTATRLPFLVLGDADANGGDTTATSGDATGGDGGRRPTPTAAMPLAGERLGGQADQRVGWRVEQIPNMGIAAARSIRRATRAHPRATGQV